LVERSQNWALFKHFLQYYWEIRDLWPRFLRLWEIHVFFWHQKYLSAPNDFLSLWHLFESFTIVGTRISAAKAGFVHGDSHFCSPQDLWIYVYQIDQKI